MDKYIFLSDLHKAQVSVQMHPLVHIVCVTQNWLFLNHAQLSSKNHNTIGRYDDTAGAGKTM